MSEIQENKKKVSADTIDIRLYKSGKNDPEMKIKIPLATFNIAWKLIPVKIKAMLDSEGIDLAGFCEFFLSKPPPKGLLIEIENKDNKLALLSE